MEEIKCEPIIYDDYNGRIRADQDCIGTLTTNCGNDALRNGVKIIDPVMVDEIYNNRKPRVYSEYCPTIRAERQGLEVIEPAEQYVGCAVHPVSKKLEFDGYKDSECPTLLATDYKCPKTVAFKVEPNLEQDEFDMGIIYELSKTYRIRKLTPNECGRLMGVKFKDCEKLAKNQSTSSQYHLYGDSIATTCLMAILGELFGVDYQSKINTLVEELKQ